MELEVKRHLVNSPSRLKALIQRLLVVPDADFDVETGDPKLHINPDIVGVQFGFESKGVWNATYMPVKHVTTTHYEFHESTGVLSPVYELLPECQDNDTVWRMLHPVFQREDLVLRGSYLKYDLKRAIAQFRRLGLDPTIKCQIVDTVIASHFCHQPDNKLKNNVRRIFKAEVKDFLEICPTPDKSCEVPIADMAPYGQDDVIWPKRLEAHFVKEMRRTAPRKVKLLRGLEGDIVKCLAHMEAIGIHVDPEVLQRLGDGWIIKRDTLDAQIAELLPREINLNSTQQVSSLLFDELKWWDAKGLSRSLKAFNSKFVRGKNGHWPTGEEVLKDIQYFGDCTDEGRRFVDLYLARKKWEKMANTFAYKLVRHIADDGRIHTNFWHLGARTLRFTSSGPNLQQVPKRDQESSEIRTAFTATPGGEWVLVGADYSQVEMRVLAHYSEDPVLLRVFKNNEDPHQTTADETGLTRDVSKILNYAVLYGAGVNKLARSLKVPRETASAYQHKFYDTYAAVEKFIHKCHNVVEQTHQIENLFGHTRSFQEFFDEGRYWKNAAFNTPIQSSAGAIVKIAMRNLYNELVHRGWLWSHVRMLLQVHDELIFEARKDVAEEFQLLLKQIMENAVNLRVPLLVDSGKGNNWLQCH